MADLARIRQQLLDESLVRATASGRRRGKRPAWRRAELRYVDLKAGRRLQVVTYSDTQAFTSNHEPGAEAEAAVDALLAEPFDRWRVETAAADAEDERPHDRRKQRLLPEDDPVLVALGFSGADGRIKPSRQAKYRQVEEFLRALDAALAGVDLPVDRPLRVADLGCGNAYLTFAAHRFLSVVRGIDVVTTGVDVKRQSLEHNTEMAERLGLGDAMRFVQAPIAASALSEPPDVVLALHACDTATDDALGAAVAWGSALVLAAPCCHHDIAAQLRHTPAPEPYGMLTHYGILRERFADTLTDALRAAVLRRLGYRVEVTEFVESKHTPRNTLLRATLTASSERIGSHESDDLDALLATWNVAPRLMEVVGDRLG